MAKGRKLKFPDPGDYALNTPAVMCPAERVIGLYNQANDADGQRISKSVRTWFEDEAHRHGWRVYFLPEVQSKHGAGCIMWRTGDPKTMVVGTSLVLAENAGFVDDDE